MGLAKQLCDLTGRAHALVTGRGATAIFLALRASGLRAEQVVLPGNICPAAVCPVVYSGNAPAFCDVRLSDFNTDPGGLKEALARGPAAAIIPHAYGHVAPMGEIARLCGKAGALLIEDAAAALGAEPDGAPAGSWGDCSVLSFGYAKIVDAGKGGALLTDNRELYREARRVLAALPEGSPAADRRATDLAHVVRGWWTARKTEPRLDGLLRPLWTYYPDAHLWRLPAGHEVGIAAGLSDLRETLARREANFAAYQAALADSPILRPQPERGSVCWRYTCLVPERARDALVDDLRASRLDVSTLYPAAHRQFDTPVPAGLPNCERLEREVINLWVAPPLTPADIRANAETVRTALARAADRQGGRE